MSNPIIDFFEQQWKLSNEEKEALKQIPIEEFKKGTVLLREGDRKQLCYFVLKGCVREYVLKDGEEKTTNFFTEFQVLFDPEVYSEGKPSKYYWVCEEDCLLTFGSPESEAEMYDKFPGIEKMGKVEADKMIASKNDRTNSFVTMTPEERYLDLMERRPDLLQRVPQYHLASYLGVKPETLSRIRKRLATKVQ